MPKYSVTVTFLPVTIEIDTDDLDMPEGTPTDQQTDQQTVEDFLSDNIGDYIEDLPDFDQVTVKPVQK